jgi:hypothetical protein
MQFVIVVLIIRFVIALAVDNSRKEKTVIKRNDARDPAAFQLR